MPARKQAIERIMAEYHEMPGLRLYEKQVRRLFHLDPETTKYALDNLVGAGFLGQTPDGAYYFNDAERRPIRKK